MKKDGSSKTIILLCIVLILVNINTILSAGQVFNKILSVVGILIVHYFT